MQQKKNSKMTQKNCKNVFVCAKSKCRKKIYKTTKTKTKCTYYTKSTFILQQLFIIKSSLRGERRAKGGKRVKIVKMLEIKKT